MYERIHIYAQRAYRQRTGQRVRLQLLRGRDYGSMMRTFLSPDPLLNGAHPNDPQTWNRYMYGLNNPLKIVDPT